MIQYVKNDDEGFHIVVEGNKFDEQTLKQLKEKYNVFFMTDGDGVIPVMVEGDMVFLGIDASCGELLFKNTSLCFDFHISWAKHLIADLQAAISKSKS